MGDLKKHDVTIRYIATEHPQIQSVWEAKEIARSLFYDWWDGRWGTEPEVLDITVDGQVFKNLEEVEWLCRVLNNVPGGNELKRMKGMGEEA